MGWCSLREGLGFFILVRPDPERPADMVEDDRGLRIGAGEIGKLGELGMVKPGLEGEVERRQPRKAGAPGGIEHLPLTGLVRASGNASLSSRATEWRMPRKRPSPGVIWASSTFATASPSRRSAWPTIPWQSRIGPYWPL